VLFSAASLRDSEYFAFANVVKSRSRYLIAGQDWDAIKHRDFLDIVRRIGQSRIEELPIGVVLHRAQRDCAKKDDGQLAPYSPERMKPCRTSATEGRVNPKGIPCLYLANSPETSMAEMRPWMGAKITVGAFVTNRQLRIMNCTLFSSFLSEQGPESDDFVMDLADQDSRIWHDISYAFSKPVNPESDRTADYAPTQILAEVFRAMGCHGIKYKSLLGGQSNSYSYALFDLDDADCVKDSLTVRECKGIGHLFD
jgi:RES domain-containing protein